MLVIRRRAIRCIAPPPFEKPRERLIGGTTSQYVKTLQEQLTRRLRWNSRIVQQSWREGLLFECVAFVTAVDGIVGREQAVCAHVCIVVGLLIVGSRAQRVGHRLRKVVPIDFGNLGG